MSCLDDSPKNRPPVAQVSMTIKRVKDVYTQKSSCDSISPIVWWAEVSSNQSQVSYYTRHTNDVALWDKLRTVWPCLYYIDLKVYLLTLSIATLTSCLNTHETLPTNKMNLYIVPHDVTIQ